jgi:methyl-accepting chemotaxis protein
MDIKESLHRILEQKKAVSELFYQVFLNSCPEARSFFEKTNMSLQAMNLSIALILIERFHHVSYGAVEEWLKCLGSKHQDWGVPLELYQPFREALLETLKQHHGPDWGAEVEDQWRTAIDRASQVMGVGYQQRFHV